ncbi:MAG: hypothetical protein JWP92_2166 [Caulobacter sp.]|nr:hypothetical protein [Caulobacter sp.]
MRLQDFFIRRPVLYGGPAAAALGAVLALSLRVGDQAAPYSEPMSARLDTQVAEAEPIAWPSGKVPDYVIGTDFLRRPERWDAPVEVATAPMAEAYQPVDWRFEPEPPPRPAVDVPAAETRWPSSQGDIVNVSLPEDAPAQPTPVRTASSPSAVEVAPT